MSDDQDLPHSLSAERNIPPLCEALEDTLPHPSNVLEIASGTGQHAEAFTERFDWLTWQPTEPDPVATGLTARLSRIDRPNLRAPLTLDLANWPDTLSQYDAIFSANCIHIVLWDLVVKLVEGAAGAIKPGGRLMFYGPFRIGGGFEAASNAAFDAHLRAGNPESGIRDLEALDEVCAGNGFEAAERREMPANNLLVIYRRLG